MIDVTSTLTSTTSRMSTEVSEMGKPETLAQRNLEREELLNDLHKWITKSLPYKAPESVYNELQWFAQQIERLKEPE